MERSFEELKERLWDQFESVCSRASSSFSVEDRIKAGLAVGTIGEALVAVYREEREATAQKAAQGGELKKGLG